MVSVGVVLSIFGDVILEHNFIWIIKDDDKLIQVKQKNDVKK